MDCEALGEEIEQWYESVFHHARIGRRFYVRTGLPALGWLDCEIHSHSWITQLIEIIGSDLAVISHDLTILVVIYEEEDEYQAFHSTQPTQ